MLLFFIFFRKHVFYISYKNNYFYINEQSFELSWIHSVEKEPWFEKYELQNGRMFLVETWFKSFGAGTPYDGEIIQSNDSFTHMELNFEVSEITLTISNNVKTTIYTTTKKIPLYKIVDNYDAVTIGVKKVSLWQLLRGESFDYKK